MTSTWLIGRGLLGKAVLRQAPGGRIWQARTPIPWGSGEEVGAAFHRAAKEFFDQRCDDDWEVAWCAGAGVVGSDAATFELEIMAFSSMLAALDTYGDTAGKVFFASSVGAIHGGTIGPPFDEGSERVPISPYGAARLRQEDLLRDWTSSAGHRAVIARITNLYGPGQHLGKSQGLISQICKSYLLRQPIRLYVSLETKRDYLYVDDAGEMVLASLVDLDEEPGGSVSVRVLGSGVGVTLGGVLQTCARVLRRPLRVITVQSELRSMQSVDLRVHPRRPVLLRAGTTSLSVGVRRTFDDQLRQFQTGRLMSSAVPQEPRREKVGAT